MEIKEIYIKNFRNIGEEGAEIKLSPITIFTGCNSAGKSTAAKALLLLESYLSDVKANNYNLIDTPLDFSKVVKLGTFDTVLNSSAKVNGQENIVMGYCFNSIILSGDIHIRLTFGKKAQDFLHNGWLEELSVFVDSTELVSVKVVDCTYKIDIKSNSKFIEYINCYKVRQILALWRKNSNILDKLKTEAIYENKISDLLQVEKNLLLNGVIKDRFWTKDIDNNIVSCELLDIVSSIEGILDISGIYVGIYEIEEREHRRFNCHDLEKMAKAYEEKHRSLLREYPSIYKEFKLILDEYQTYIDSDASNILDFTRNLNEDYLDEYIDSFNKDSHQDVYGNGILDVISNNFTELVSPKWVRLALHYLLFHSLSLEMSGQIEYVNAATVNVKRLYLLDSSDRFGNMWKRYNNLSRNPVFQEEKYDFAKRYWEGKTGEFMRKWLRELGICDEIKIENIEGSLRIKMFSKEYPEGRLLADQGYGITQLVALLLNIEIALNKIVQYDLTYVGLNHEVGPGYVGYKHSWLIVEEPEVHLHPSLQSRLTDIFLDASRHGLRLIVETHSEYLVRRSQVIVAQMNLKDEDLAYENPFRVYYFPESKPPYDMNYRPDGCFWEEFGTGFFDEASKLAFKLF